MRGCCRVVIVWLVAAGTSGACVAPDTVPRVPARTGVVDLEIGELDGSGPETFARITGLAQLHDGRLLVLDGGANEGRVFAPDGRFLFSFGRAGAGPGEFNDPCCVGLDPGNRVWIRDGGNARYDVFEIGDTAAQYRFSVRMGHGDVNFWAPLTFDGRGRLIDIGHRPDGDGLGIVRLHTDTAGVVTDSVRIPAVPIDSTGLRVVSRATPAGNVVRYLYPPWGPVELLTHGPAGQYAKAVSSAYRIAWYDSEGALLRVVREPDRPGPEPTAEERQRAQARIDEEAERLGLSATERFAVPRRKQPLSMLAFDEKGRLWVLFTRAAGAPNRADVRNPDGSLAFTAEWPGGIDILWAGILGDTVVLGVRRDSLGVESLVRIRWRQ